jgi:poly-D-alanine transfer protein DltD
MDTNFNVLKSFKDKHWFNVIYQDETYRFEELQSFISICKELGINATFVLGPVNNRFIQNYQPKALVSYNQTTNKIRDLLISNEVSYVDATDISDELGAFNDHQHHSAYGAYLIYLKIKAKFHE